MKFIINIANENIHKSGIYKISNDITSEIYIGSTNDFIRRAKQHEYKIKLRKHNSKINHLLKIYPDIIFTFSILEISTDYKKLEYDYIHKLNTVEHGLNILNNPDDYKLLYVYKHPQKKEKFKVKLIKKVLPIENYITGYVRKKKRRKLFNEPRIVSDALLYFPHKLYF